MVYNADAFNILKNESLRKLVQQLPNTKIEEGVIYVNGKAIESLLFSGKDFSMATLMLRLTACQPTL